MSSSGYSDDSIRVWKFRSQEFQTGRLPLLMGIVNVTPDSFSDGGQFLDTERAVHHGLKLAGDGADLLDIGGESTRPGAEPVPPEEELERVIPVIEQLAPAVDVPLSIDTTKAEVARRALQAGAAIVNDISGLTFDAGMPQVCREAEAGVIVMHIQGTPQTMQENPRYEDVVGEICRFLEERLNVLEQEGIPRERVVLDPGVGFGKTAEHNLEILSHIRELRSLGRPVLVGHSRKRFLQKILGRPVDERTLGTVGVSIALAMQSTDILRVHDVQSVRDALLGWQAIAEKIE